MTTTAAIGALMLLTAGNASAGRHCGVDLEPLASIYFTRSVIDDSTSKSTQSVGLLVISKGGAVSLMRTDVGCCGEKVKKTFVAGQLGQSQLHVLLDALQQAASSGPPAACFVESTPDPPTGQSVFGGTEFTLYEGGNLPLRFNVQRSDPDVPVPHCGGAAQALDEHVFALEDALRQGLQPLQCVPFLSGS